MCGLGAEFVLIENRYVTIMLAINGPSINWYPELQESAVDQGNANGYPASKYRAEIIQP
jgi:hypothetical protein